RTPAVVKVQRSDVRASRMRREVAVLYALQEGKTPSVVRLLPAGGENVVGREPGVMRTWNGDEALDFVLELLPVGEHRTVIKRARLTQSAALAVCLGASAALRVMHLFFHVIHNDLKPDNLVAWRDPRDGRIQVRLLDFGQAALLAPHPRWPLPCITPEPQHR